MAFLITLVFVLPSSNVLAATSNTSDTLDIEKSAIETTKNSQSVKTFIEQISELASDKPQVDVF